MREKERDEMMVRRWRTIFTDSSNVQVKREREREEEKREREFWSE